MKWRQKSAEFGKEDVMPGFSIPRFVRDVFENGVRTKGGFPAAVVSPLGLTVPVVGKGQGRKEADGGEERPQEQQATES